eukprot:scaffold39181_cov40-Phaeocystis_antarctica.AAC.1
MHAVRVVQIKPRYTPPDSILYWSYHGFFLATPLSRDARLCAPANQRVEMSSRQWCVRPRSHPAPTRAPGGDCVRPLIAYRLRLSCAAGCGVQRPQARCPRARTGSTSQTTALRSPACCSPSSATPTRTPRP